MGGNRGPKPVRWMVESNGDPKDHDSHEQSEVTLSAFTETGQAESSIEVPKQRSYTGRRFVIPSSLADTPCAELGVQGVLDQLNTILGTSHTLDTTPSSSTSSGSPSSPAPSFWFRLWTFITGTLYRYQHRHSLLSLLKDFITKKYDFGTAYGLLRPVWNTESPCKIWDELRRRKEKDRVLRCKALVGKRIVDPKLPPRRVWDLYSNRVVPSWVSSKRPRPISHAWVDEDDRVKVWTLINGKEWLVPIPKGADLNLIRIEMLNLGTEYTWLDVLCLRQKEMEVPHIPEWTLDVPIIGHVYEDTYVVVYLNGLGRPLRLKDGDFNSKRNWFRRAWTVQEIGSQGIIIAGDTPDGPMHARPDRNGEYETGLLTTFHTRLLSLKKAQYDIFAVLADMQTRVSTYPVDKVAGLAFPLLPRAIPAYHESETLEDAWIALVNEMYPMMRARLFFSYPGAGLRCKKWRPSWHQVMHHPLPKDNKYFDAEVHHNDKTGEDWLDGPCIEKGRVRGFDAGLVEGVDRSGELVVEATDGTVHTFKIYVNHQFPIPEDTYTLLGDISTSYTSLPWVIGRRLPDQTFEKVSVIMMVRDQGTYDKLRYLISPVSRIVLR